MITYFVDSVNSFAAFCAAFSYLFLDRATVLVYVNFPPEKYQKCPGCRKKRIQGILLSWLSTASEAQAHLIPDDASVRGDRNALIGKAELCVIRSSRSLHVSTSPRLPAAAHLKSRALKAPRAAAAAVLRDRVDAEDHLPCACPRRAFCAFSYKSSVRSFWSVTMPSTRKQAFPRQTAARSDFDTPPDVFQNLLSSLPPPVESTPPPRAQSHPDPIIPLF